jgi:Leucine-rich repeat (LRR) protein
MIDEALLQRIRSNEYTGTEDEPDDGKLFLNISEESDLEGLLDALKTNTHINYLYINGEDYVPSDNGVLLLSELNLKELCLYGFSIKDRGHILARNEKIVKLSVSSCFVEDKDIYDIIRNNRSIKSLSMIDNLITKEGLAALPFNDTLEEVWVGKQFMRLPESFAWPNPAGAEIVPYFMKMKNLTSLNLGENQIGDEGAKILATHPSLKKLNLYKNNIGSEGALAFANNSILEVLNLGKNSIFSDGLMDYSNMTSLVELDLSHNHIDDKAVMALRQMPSLKKLNMEYTRITSVFIEHFRESGIQMLTNGTLAHPTGMMLKAFESKKKAADETGESSKRSKMKFSKREED